MGGPEDTPRHEDPEELLRRALLDAQAAASVALRVQPLSTCEALTIIFHGRRDLGTIQTYVAHGGLGTGAQVGARDLLRVPCDLDLGNAAGRDEAEELYAAQARALRDAIQAADTVLAVWREPLEDAAGSAVAVDRSIDLPVQLPAHRLMPVALVAPDRGHDRRAGVRGAHARRGPPADGDRASPSRTSPASTRWPRSPRRAWTTSSPLAADHAREMAERLDHQEASVQRFLELSGDDDA